MNLIQLRVIWGCPKRDPAKFWVNPIWFGIWPDTGNGSVYKSSDSYYEPPKPKGKPKNYSTKAVWLYLTEKILAWFTHHGKPNHQTADSQRGSCSHSNTCLVLCAPIAAKPTFGLPCHLNWGLWLNSSLAYHKLYSQEQILVS